MPVESILVLSLCLHCILRVFEKVCEHLSPNMNVECRMLDVELYTVYIINSDLGGLTCSFTYHNLL